MIVTLFSQPPIYFVLPLFLTVVGAMLFGGPGQEPINIYLLIGCIVSEALVAVAVSQTDGQAARQWAYASVVVMLVWVMVTPAFRYLWKLLAA
jgi:preprotein translocase subunit SecF